MKKIGKSSISFDDVYLYETSCVTGPKEALGKLKNYYDYSFEDLNCLAKSWEQAEMKLQEKAIEIVLNKSKLDIEDIYCIFSGDLNNQIAISNYTMRNYDIPHIGIYAACSTLTLGLILASVFIESGLGEYVGAVTSSHYASSEKQFRNPTEYGGQKPNSVTSTVTGSGAAILSKNKSKIKLTKATFGTVVDIKLCDPLDLGRTMAPAAVMTLRQHLEDFNINPNEYDLILTGDLSTFGSKTFINILKEFDIFLKNYNDCGLMIYDLNKQEVYAGGSGCACSAVVMYGYIVKEMKNNKLKKVLIIATGALMNSVIPYQKESIPAIAHAVVLERVPDDIS